ncbi:MAG: hypothetical protein EBU49_00505 [Proteobacteria bacterium]|nr:hypothetical protein [Pseudomonadota bacterium]
MTMIAIIEMSCFSIVAIAAGKMERIGGDYRLQGISRKCPARPDGSCFRVIFEAVHKTGRFDELVLESNHVNVSVKKGDVVRLSAEIAVDRGKKAEVSQVVLFDDSGKSRPPTWILSSKHRAGSGPASRYIDMHVPQTDFLVL